MDYRFKIYEKTTNTESEKYKSVGYYTSLSKQKAIEYAVDWLKKHDINTYYAILYSFDWSRGNRAVGKIDLAQ